MGGRDVLRSPGNAQQPFFSPRFGHANRDNEANVADALTLATSSKWPKFRLQSIADDRHPWVDSVPLADNYRRLEFLRFTLVETVQ